MPLIRYQNIKMHRSSREIVSQCNEIIGEYALQGLMLTLRQLYYQMVARDLLPNTLQSYKRLGGIVSDARLAGMMDWDAIEDRTRNLMARSHWASPGDIIAACASSYHVDMWQNQSVRPEVWIEKEALSGVFARICDRLDVPYFACRGYTSQSEMWGAAMRFVKHLKDGKQVHVLHFGDHDPSGIDMTRDIEDRIRDFAEHHVMGARHRITIRRLALNMPQIDEYGPPENPAKATDSRFEAYQEKFGDSSWELDALNPTILSDLVEANVKALRVERIWEADERYKEAGQVSLGKAAEHWDEVEAFVEEIDE